MVDPKVAITFSAQREGLGGGAFLAMGVVGLCICALTIGLLRQALAQLQELKYSVELRCAPRHIHPFTLLYANRPRRAACPQPIRAVHCSESAGPIVPRPAGVKLALFLTLNVASVIAQALFASESLGVEQVRSTACNRPCNRSSARSARTRVQLSSLTSAGRRWRAGLRPDLAHVPAPVHRGAVHSLRPGPRPGRRGHGAAALAAEPPPQARRQAHGEARRGAGRRLAPVSANDPAGGDGPALPRVHCVGAVAARRAAPGAPPTPPHETTGPMGRTPLQCTPLWQ